ncbi:hypothetical protein CYMTET_14142 [Cymbomonas tetramitiformis]|uniref:Uncharacterized protein n=1 Tax=Cymbomonas tetramitiformis TaxID=36881 RepID=A0AAE0LAN6_9CHLO|nr:hypothetical protein CYMTET_14142 [Cymbomonas tetramitiformis]
MPLRREFEEYWDDIDQNFVQEPAAGGQTWKDRAYPQAADQRKKLENSLSDIDAQMAELEAAKKAVLQAKKLSDRKKEQEAKLDKCRTEEEAAQGRVRYVSENDALSFCRGFHAAYHEERAAAPGRPIHQAQPFYGIGRPDAQHGGAAANRQKAERWGVKHGITPIFGGGHTMALHRVQSARQAKEDQLLLLQQENELYQGSSEQLANAKALYQRMQKHDSQPGQSSQAYRGQNQGEHPKQSSQGHKQWLDRHSYISDESQRTLSSSHHRHPGDLRYG